MRITTLIENSTCREDLPCEHGLSFYIETENYKILFDAGQTDAFAENAEKLGIDLSKADFAVLSHGHYDHGGGFLRFLQINQTAPIYLNRDAFMPHFNGEQKDIGLNPALRDCTRLVYTDDCTKIADGITLYSCNRRQRPYPFGSFGLTVQEHGALHPDDFRHEQYLLIEEKGKRVCFSGCSHKGVLNITGWFLPDVLIGGFHFMKLEPDEPGRQTLEDSADALLHFPAVYYTGHCTGLSQFAYLKKRMGDRVHALSTGTVIAL